MAEVVLKRCPKCRIQKDPSEFYKTKSTKDGLTTWCKACNKANCKKFNDRSRRKRTCKTYGLTEEEYNTRLEEQNHVCAICHKPSGFKRLSIDHDHTTGKVRGLLCFQCNTGLGVFKDNPILLMRAIQYLG